MGRSETDENRILGKSRIVILAAVMAAAGWAAYANAQSPAIAEDKSAPPTALEMDQKLITEGRGGSEIMKNLTHLSDEIGPRLTGSANLKRANEWAAEKMKSYGLTNVQLEPWSIPVGWKRGTVNARLIQPDNGRSLLMASAGWSPGTNGKVVGNVVVMEARNSKDLAQYKGKLKDAIVLRGAPSRVMPINDNSGRSDGFTPGAAGTPNRREGARNARPNPERPADAPKAEAQPKTDPEKKPTEPAKPAQSPPADANPSPRAERARYSEFAAFRAELSDFLRTEGALAMLSDASKPQGLLITTGGWRGTDRADSPEPVPHLYVAHEHYALLHRLANRSEAKPARVELEVANDFVPGPIVVYNTIGEIKGSEKPDEFVVLGAHIDSWDLAQGTTDNGTGTCIVLEAARILAKSGAKPKRTIRFCLFSGEEQGLHGSRAYVKKHEAEMPKTSMCLVHDTGTGKVTGIGIQGRAVLKPLLEQELIALKDLDVGEINLRSMGGSDHMAFEDAGVPGFMIAQDMTEYRFTHHTQTDTLDKVNEPNLIQGAQVMAITGLRVANLPTLLPREKPERPARRGGGM